jgi:multiple sugar transport system substrate-binding protein
MKLHRLIAILAIAVGAVCVAATAGARVAVGTKAATTTITFWNAYSSDGPEVKRLEKVLIPEFEKTHPGITVNAVTIPYDQLHQKLVTAVAGGQLPDLVRSDIIWVPELANLGVLEPLDKSLPNFQKMAARVFAGPLATNYWKGHYYGLPLDTNTRIWVYNPATLKEIGASAPPKTFAQLQTMSAAAKAKGLYLYAESGTSGWNILPWIWSNGGSLTNKTYTKATGFLNGPKSVAAVQMLVNLYKAGEMPDIVVNSNSGLGTYDGLNQGKYVGMLDGPWSFAIFSSAFKNTQLAGSLVPSGPGGSVSVVGGEDIVMTKSSKHKAVAAQFIRFMLSPDAQDQMARAGQMPVLKNSTSWLLKIHPYYGTYLKQIATAQPRTPTPKWPQIDQVLVTQIAKAFQGEPVQQALTEAASQIDALLK